MFGRTLRRYAAPALAAALVFAFSWLLRYNEPEGGFAGLLDDHYFYLVRGWQMLRGELPDRDFVDIGAPLTYAISAALAALLGHSTWPEYVFSVTMLSAAAALTCFAAARASGAIALGVAAALFEIALLPRYYNYPKLIVYAAAIPATWALVDRPSLGRRALVAAITVVAMLLRHDHGIFVGVFVVTAVFLAARSWRDRLMEAARYGALVVLFSIPYLAYLQVHHGIGTHFVTANSWSMRDRGRAPLKWPSFDTVNPEGGTPTPLAFVRRNVVTCVFYFLVGLPLVALAIAPLSDDAWRPDWPRAREKIAAVAVLGLALNVGFLRGSLAARLADVSVPNAIVLAWLVAVVLRVLRRGTLVRRGQARHIPAPIRVLWPGATLTVAGLVFAATVAGIEDQFTRSGFVEGPGALVGRAQHWTRRLQATWPLDSWADTSTTGPLRLAFYLNACTKPTDRVFVSPYLPQVPALSGRAFAGGHPDLRPGFFETRADQELFLQRFEQQSVPVLILGPMDEFPGFQAAFPLVAEHFLRRYQPIGDRELGDGKRVGLMVERNRQPSGRYELLDLPCYR
jgi:hypothetical protein